MEYVTIIYFSIAVFMFLFGHLGCWFHMYRMDDSLKTRHKVLRLSPLAKIINLTWYVMGVGAAFMTCDQVMEILDLPLFVRYEVLPPLNDQSWAVLTGMWMGSLTHGYTRFANNNIAKLFEEITIRFFKGLYLEKPNL